MNDYVPGSQKKFGGAFSLKAAMATYPILNEMVFRYKDKFMEVQRANWFDIVDSNQIVCVDIEGPQDDI